MSEAVDQGAPGAAHLPRTFRFTVDDAFAMGETGIFREERVELIGGQFLVKEPHAPSHSGKVDRLAHLLHQTVGETNIVRVQSGLRISDVDLPEPDVAILRQREDFYETAHPAPEDVLLVIEVANTSLRFDQSTKASLYAAAGIKTYWIVDVKGQTVRVHTNPSDDTYGDDTYSSVRTYAPGDALTLPTTGSPHLSVSDVFPGTEPRQEDEP